MDNIVIPSSPSTENMSFQVYADIRMKLITGKLMPDQALSIRTLATEYDISAMPVREALRQLASEDALIGAAKKAYRVPNLLSSEAANLFYVRAVLEGAAAEIVAGVIDKQNVEHLWGLTSGMNVAWKNEDAEEFLRINFKFHSYIYTLAQNPALARMVENLYIRTGPWLALGIKNLSKFDLWQSDHDAIIDALANNDAATARTLMENDSGWGRKLYQEKM